jgi:hypothetical protein
MTTDHGPRAKLQVYGNGGIGFGLDERLREVVDRDRGSS